MRIIYVDSELKPAGKKVKSMQGNWSFTMQYKNMKNMVASRH